MPKPEITIIGHVGRDPKPNTTYAGTPVATFPVAENHWRWDGMMRQWLRTGTSWYHVTCKWGLSEHVAESIRTGDPVIVVGRLKIAEWSDDNGVKQVTADVDATSVGHDLRRGTVKFTKAAPAKTKAPSGEEDEIRASRDEPPAEPPDPFASTANGSGDEPSADPPAGEDDDEAPPDVESASFDGDDAFPAADDDRGVQPVG